MSSAFAAGSADDRVYRAVATHQTAAEVRRVIESSQSAAAAVNQAGANGETPLRAACRLCRGDLACLLLQNGAEGAGDVDWNVAVGRCVQENDLAGLRRLMERGASVNAAPAGVWTPLMGACSCSRRTADRRDLTLEILRRSSAETRRAVDSCGWSAVDHFILGHAVQPLQPWHAELISELLAAGAPVHPDHAVSAVPIAAALAARREAEVAALPPLGHDWREQETIAGLSMDMGELREAEREVLERRARLAMLELALSSGTDSGGSGNESESESESEEGEATGWGGGGR